MPIASPFLRAALPNLLLVAAALLFTGCQTPDLKPFGAASAGVASAIRQGGDLAIQQIAREPAAVGNTLVEPGSPNHPAAALTAEWEPRRRAADALLAYSGALAAIADTSANRKANATALLDSVKQLASAVPGLSLGSSAAGNLLISAASGIVEIKAWRDLGDAVKNADPAIALIGAALARDFAAMSDLQASFHLRQINLLKAADAHADLLNLSQALRAQQQTARAAVASRPADVAAGNELARLDGLLASAAKDFQPRLDSIARHRTALADGTAFYQAAISGINAWAAAHRDLVTALTEKRAPNLALLLARAQELQTQIEAYKQSRRTSATP